MKNAFLTGEKIYLSPLIKEDITEEYVNWLNDTEVCKENSHATIPNTFKKTLSYIESIEKSNTDFVFAIRWKKNDKHIGNVSIQNINRINRTAEIAILIGNKKYWGKGIGSEAYKLVIDYGFKRLNLNRISSGQTVTNKSMIQVCVNNGMKREGILREIIFKNGKYLDAVVYSILFKDYKKKEVRKANNER